MNKIKWIIFAAVAISILGLLVAVSNESKVKVENINTNDIQSGNDESGGIGDNIFGKADAKVTLIEYGDYQCPPCASIQPIVKSVVEQYNDKIRFIFRHFPIASMHPNAKAASGAAEAAGLQGKYWDMHYKLYENQNKWSGLSGSERTNFFVNYAKELGLDESKFKSDFASNEVLKKINYDMALGVKAGVEGTPSIFLNGVKLDQSIVADATKLTKAIDVELAKN